MKFSHIFIRRPIFAAVIAIFIVIVGGLAYLRLPVAQFPEVAPPTVTVTASYPGANAQIAADTVATPIEQEINGVENMIYMSSQSTSDGNVSITVTFELGTNLDLAQVLVQNRVAVAEPRLPAEVRQTGVVVKKNTPDILMVVHMLSPDNSYDQLYISNYALLQVRDVVARVKGVGSVLLYGVREYSMRAWLDPDKIASLGMTATEVVSALQQQNIQVAGGALGQPPMPNDQAFQTSLQLKGRLVKPEEFGDIVVKTGADGRITRLRDVARVELGGLDYTTNGFLDGKPAVVLLVSQTPGANALAVANSVKETMADLSKSFPKGIEYRIVYNPTEFIQRSVDELIKTIYEAVLLVVIVVLVFLQTWRATIIPVVAIPVSLIGTFFVMAALGFSINNLTLFGLVLAVGIVVDDAIVVVENVERKIEEGLSPREAAFATMDEVGVALISIALVLCAVFIPTAFLQGIVGQFYRQFALTIAVATVISAFNSLTLSPALCALVLRSREEKEKKHRFDISFLTQLVLQRLQLDLPRPRARLLQICCRHSSCDASDAPDLRGTDRDSRLSFRHGAERLHTPAGSGLSCSVLQPAIRLVAFANQRSDPEEPRRKFSPRRASLIRRPLRVFPARRGPMRQMWARFSLSKRPSRSASGKG